MGGRSCFVGFGHWWLRWASALLCIGFKGCTFVESSSYCTDGWVLHTEVVDGVEQHQCFLFGGSGIRVGTQMGADSAFKIILYVYPRLTTMMRGCYATHMMPI